MMNPLLPCPVHQRLLTLQTTKRRNTPLPFPRSPPAAQPLAQIMPDFAKNIVTGFARLEGHPVAIVVGG